MTVLRRRPASLAVPWIYLGTTALAAVVATGAAAALTVRRSTRQPLEVLRDL